jgi:trehalose/maltose hydrolase-like predicted phosphorylase
MPAPGRLEGGALEQFSGYALLPDQRAGEPDPIGRPTLSGEVAERAQTLKSFSTKLIKEADVVFLHALFPWAFGDEQKALDLDFYEPRTTFESSLAASPYGIVAAMLGRTATALRCFRLSACYNLGFEPRAGYRNGVHLAAYAGAWQVLVQGLLGVRLGEEVLTFRPRPLPDGWQSLRLRLVWRGVPLGLCLTREELAIDAAPRGVRVPVAPTAPTANSRRDRVEIDLGGGRRALVEVGEAGR